MANCDWGKLAAVGDLRACSGSPMCNSGAVWWTLLWSSKSFSMKAYCYWSTDKLAETSVDNGIPLNGPWGSRMSRIRRTQLKWIKHLTMMPPRWCASGIPHPLFHNMWGQRKITSLLTSIISLGNTPVHPQTSWRRGLGKLKLLPCNIVKWYNMHGNFYSYIWTLKTLSIFNQFWKTCFDNIYSFSFHFISHRSKFVFSPAKYSSKWLHVGLI